jgi:Flp pilus assembly protein TadB
VAYLAIVVAISAVGIAVLVWRQRARTPRTVDDSITRFAQARNAISPASRPRTTQPAADAVRRDQQRRRQVSVQRLRRPEHDSSDE